MKTLIIAFALGTLITAPVFIQSANAAPFSDHVDAARARAIRECSAVQKRNPDESWGGAQLWHYRACMSEHGQPE